MKSEREHAVESIPAAVTNPLPAPAKAEKGHADQPRDSQGKFTTEEAAREEQRRDPLQQAVGGGLLIFPQG